MPTDELSRILGPRQTILITARAEQRPLGVSRDVDDVHPTDHHLLLSADPLIYGVALPKDAPISKAIMDSRCFAVNFVAERFSGIMHHSISENPSFQDKFKSLDVEKDECRHIEAPCIKDSLAVLEAELIQTEEFSENLLFIGKVLGQRLERDEHRPFHLEGGRFTTTEANR